MKTKISKVLVTGGAGYIGTNVVNLLLQKNYDVVVIDNYLNSYQKYITSLKEKYKNKLSLIEFDLLDKKQLDNFFAKNQFDAVIHLAGKKYVNESVLVPEEYYKYNVVMTKQLLEVMEKYNVKHLVFSSSITVYGNCRTFPVRESHKRNPISPYAQNKRDCEDIIKKWSKKTNSFATVLRLCNLSGANTKDNFGDNAKNQKYTNLLSYIIKNIDNGNALVFRGNNFKTKDGTAVRDYVCISDVARAFVCALENNDKTFEVYNIGNGIGTTVLELFLKVKNNNKSNCEYRFESGKSSEAPIFIADVLKANKDLGFVANCSIEEIVKSQVEFLKKQN